MPSPLNLILFWLEASTLRNRGEMRQHLPADYAPLSPTSGWKPVPLILEEEVGIRIHAKLTEQILILLLESSLMVMLLLVLDILYDPLPFRHRVGEGSIPITPCVKVREPLPVFLDPS